MDAGNDGTGGLILSGGTNSEILLREAGVRITTNGSAGSSGQVLTSDGINSYWQTPTPTFDGVIQQTNNNVTFTNNSAASVFSGATTSGGTTASGTTFTKSSASAIYEIDLVIETFDGAIDNTVVQIELRRNGSTYVTDSKFYANYTGGSDIEMSFKFLTDNSSGNLTFVNTTGATTNVGSEIASIMRQAKQMRNFISHKIHFFPGNLGILHFNFLGHIVLVVIAISCKILEVSLG
jgi:hypothetical protein